MDITITPSRLKGCINAIPSKSQAHRLLICAAFSDKPTVLICPETNADIEATADCLRALGAVIERNACGYCVTPVSKIPAQADLNCRESGSTLRFLLPVVGALGVDAVFHMSGRLPHRPLSPLWEEMERMGCRLSHPTETTLHCCGRLKAGNYTIDGSISSQFITGLLFAMALLPGDSKLNVTGRIESRPYIQMTLDALRLFGVETVDYNVSGSLPFTSPGQITVEGDWSNGAFFLAARALGNDVHVAGLDLSSAQGDRAAASILEQLANRCTVNAEDIPDLVPILAVTAGAKNGASFNGIRRLRLKESDRVASVAAMLTALGVAVDAQDNTLTVFPGRYHACTIDSVGDHRIAMAAAIAATAADGPVTILGAECVAKSYPSFWDEYRKLGGQYEQYIR